MAALEVRAAAALYHPPWPQTPYQSLGRRSPQELPPTCSAGVEAHDDGVENARGAIDDVERRMKAVVPGLARAISAGSSSVTQPVSTLFM